MKSTADRQQGGGIPRVAEGFRRVFTLYTRHLLRRRFHSFRLLHGGQLPGKLDGPLVIYLNHASWWDPLVCLLLAHEFLPDRTSYAPIDAAMLERYGFFEKLGFFPVEQRSARGARQFLQATHSILASPRNAVWLTPQGGFKDVRERPLRLQGGLGALAAREPQVTFVPLAIEYTFWTEPRLEILASFGEPITPGLGLTLTAAERTIALTDALESTQDELAARSCRRDAAEWLTVNRGSSGVNAFYDGWRWLKARVRGERFSPEHRPEALR